MNIVNENVRLVRAETWIKGGMVNYASLKVSTPEAFIETLYSNVYMNRALGAITETEIFPVSKNISTENFLKVFNIDHPEVIKLLTFDESERNRKFTKRLYTEINKYRNSRGE